MSNQESFTHTLARPKEIRGKTLTSLTMRRPLVRDLIAAERQPGRVAENAALLAICSDVPFTDFGHLDAADYRAMMQAAEDRGFFDDGGETPDVSSESSTPGPAGDLPSSPASTPSSSSAGS